MKKLSKTLKYVALILLLGAISLYYLHFLNAAHLRFAVIVALLISSAGYVVYSFYTLKLAKASSGPMTGAKKVSYIIIYFSALIVISGLILTIFHIRVIGRDLIIFGLIVFTCGFTLMMPGIFAGLLQNRNIINVAFFRTSMLLNTVLYIFVLCCTTGMLLTMFHYAEGRLLMYAGIVLILFSFSAAVLFLKLKNTALSTTIELSSNELDRYVGVYHNEQMNMDIMMTKKVTGTALVAQPVGLPALPLTAIEKNIFVFSRAGIVIEFKPEKYEFTLIQSGCYFSFFKK